jgi:hypothetical protein
MTSKILALCLLLAAACGGSPTQADPIVTEVGDPPPVAADDAGQPDSGVIVTEAPDAGPQVDSGHVGTPAPTDDAGDAGAPVAAQDSGRPSTDAGAPPSDAGAPVLVNDAGQALCCWGLPVLNSSGIPVATMNPQPCDVWGVPDSGYSVGTVVCGIPVDPVDFVCALRQAGQTASNQGEQKVCP